ncbi:MAG: hypothetical protein H7144_16975 [Burkholderiales bacterium]|nr:hypothetical protein [Phycisphaerae bacterium]
MLVLVGMIQLAGGCRSVDPAVKRSQQTADLLVNTRETMFAGEQTVLQSQTSLRALRDSNGDLRPAFELFLTDLAAVRKQADRLKIEGESVQTQSVLYCAARQTDVSMISDLEMRQLAEKRASSIKEKCDTINDRYQQVAAGFGQYILKLNDLQTYLGNELNSGSLASGQSWIEEALASGELLRGDIRALALEIELTSNMLSPVPIAVSAWPTVLEQPNAVADQR